MATGAGIGATAGAGWGTQTPFAPGPPFLFNSLSLCRCLSVSVQQPLELLLQRLGTLAPEMSFLLAIITMAISPFSVISHSDGSRIDLGVESHFYVVPILQGAIIIDILWDVVLFCLNLHSGLHLCSVDGNVGTVVIILLMVVCLILMVVIQPLLMRICIVGSVGGFAHGLGVCLGVVHPPTPVVLSLILLTLMHGDKQLCVAGLGVISLVYNHGLVLRMQTIEKGILGMILQIPWSEYEVVKLLELNSQLNHTFIVILGHFPIALLYHIELAHQCAVCGSSTIH